MTGYLTSDELLQLRDAARSAGFADRQVRRLLLSGIHRAYVGTLPDLDAPGLQLQSDLNRLNATERLVDGSVPLEVWLHNAVATSDEAGPRAVFETMLDKVARGASGESTKGLEIGPAERKEAVVFRDDMVPFHFLQHGWEAGQAIARITVPPFEGGQRSTGHPHRGTAWLVTSHLAVTNHHVVNARRDGAPAAADDDLRRQASAATLLFDFDTEEDEAAGMPAQCAELVGWDAELDYAVLRLAHPLDRRPLPIADAPLAAPAGDHVAVNVIQHPVGEAKRVALRNNLVLDADSRDLRYFTDTRQGSSGSPVLTDDWVVVAVHRAAARAEGVSFQGKSTAVVNVGTQIAAIMQHLGVRWAGVRDEIIAAQSGLVAAVAPAGAGGDDRSAPGAAAAPAEAGADDQSAPG